MELKITSKNASNEVTVFEGMKMMGNVADVTDKTTKEIIDYVKGLPRISKYTGSSAPSVKLGEAVVKLSYKFYTDEEKATYKSYRDGHTGTGGGSTKTTKRSEEDYNAGLEALENMKKVGASKEVLDLMEAFVNRLKPVDPAVAKARAMLESLTPEQRALLGLPC